MMFTIISYSQTKKIDSLNIEIKKVEKELKEHKAKYYKSTNTSEKGKLYNHIIDDTFALRELKEHKRVLEDEIERKPKE